MATNIYCPYIYHGIYVERFINGKLAVSPCSLATNSPPTSDSVDFANNPYLCKIREENQNGIRSKACQSCWDLEDAGGESKRKVALDWHHGVDINPELYYVDYCTLPLCNARCVICGPHYSSAWAVALGTYKIADVVTHDYKQLETLDFSKIKRIYMAGGEPLLTEEHVAVLNKITNIADVDISYNTNGSCYPSDAALARWNAAKSVTLFFSIDGTQERFEETRAPLKWDQVSDNIKQINMLKNIDIHCTYTVGTHNVYDLADTIDWFAQLPGFNVMEKFHVHHVHRGHALYFDTVSSEQKQKFKDELAKFSKFHWYESIINSIGT